MIWHLIGDASMKKVRLDKDKFKKVLAKTGSTVDHEALAFTRKANAMLKENSMTWEDIELYIKDNEIIISNVRIRGDIIWKIQTNYLTVKKY